VRESRGQSDCGIRKPCSSAAWRVFLFGQFELVRAK
jgi:hypothetical protein